MIRLSNGHSFEYVLSSSSFGYGDDGWFFQKPLVWYGAIEPELFTIVTKTLTLKPLKGNFTWWNPLGSVRLIDGGMVNKIGLTNPGIIYWLEKIAPTINFKENNIVVSIHGKEEELVEMAKMLNRIPLVGIEVNLSCPNVGRRESIVNILSSVRAVKAASRHPIIIKASVDDKWYISIAAELRGVVGAISLNSVPWNMVFPHSRTPFAALEMRVGGGGGGVSGAPAQQKNWMAVGELVAQGFLPVIAPSAMSEADVGTLFKMGAHAVSFGALQLRRPWAPTQIVKRIRKQESVTMMR